MKRALIALGLGLIAVVSHGAQTLWRMASPHGDARFAKSATYATDDGRDNLWPISLPPGQHEAFTVTGWVRLVYDSKNLGVMLTTSALWCPDAIQTSNPDLLAGAAGHGTAGTDLTSTGGAITVAEFPFSAYTDATLLAIYPRGVYTVDGWASNTVTVTLGGTDYSVGPGSFNHNVLPGPSGSCVISGAGPVAIGISRTPGHRFFNETDGVNSTEDQGLTKDSILTNEIAFITFRFRSIGGGKQVYQSTLGRLDNHSALSQIKTNDMPVARYSSKGLYKVGVAGLGGGVAKTFDFFDFRVVPWWMTDRETQAVWNNGAVEISRRGIPQWRTYVEHE